MVYLPPLEYHLLTQGHSDAPVNPAAPNDDVLDDDDCAPPATAAGHVSGVGAEMGAGPSHRDTSMYTSMYPPLLGGGGSGGGVTPPP